MANVIAIGNSTTVSLTDGTNTVNIAVNGKIQESFNKKLISYDIPRTATTRDQGPSKNIIDLLQTKRTVLIQGIVSDDTFSSDGGSTYDTAIQQRDKLRNMVNAGTNVQLRIRGDTTGTFSIGDGNSGGGGTPNFSTSCNFLSLGITQIPSDVLTGDPNASPPTHKTNPNRFEVNITLLIGTGVMD